MIDNNKRLLILGKSGGGTSTGTNLSENQILLPLYFENISDTSKDVFLGLTYNRYGGRFPNISLQKSLNNTDWEDITIPTTDGGIEIITIPPKSRVYIKGVNEKFCNYQDGGYYNHYYFGLDKKDREYIFVGGNLMSLIKGDGFKTYNDKYGDVLSSYAFCKLFEDGYFSSPDSEFIPIHFEKMVVGFPSGVPLKINSNSFSHIFTSTSKSALNLGQIGVDFKSSATNCCDGMSYIILNASINNYDILTTNTKKYLYIGFTNGSTGITSYEELIDKPTIPSKTSELTNDSNFLSESNLKTINGESIVGEGNLVINSFSGSYNDLTDKPTIPDAQVNSDWNANSGISQILNKPTLSIVATSGSYNDLLNKPTIPNAQVNSDWNANSGISQILNKPNMTTQTLTFVDENNVETNVIVYIQPTV